MLNNLSSRTLQPRPSIARTNGQLNPRLQLANTPTPQSTTPGLHPVSIHQTAPPEQSSTHSIAACYSFIHLKRMKGGDTTMPHNIHSTNSQNNATLLTKTQSKYERTVTRVTKTLQAGLYELMKKNCKSLTEVVIKLRSSLYRLS